MIIIPLTRGKQAIIDDIDIDKIRRFKWCAMKGGNTFYAIAWIPGMEGKQILMHHLILPRIIGKEVDHKDRNGLNNCRNNLRYATYSQNKCNIPRLSNNKSGFRGVSFCKNRSGKKVWQAQLFLNGKPVFQKRFTTAIEAAKAYNEASLKYHGEFGFRNLL